MSNKELSHEYNRGFEDGADFGYERAIALLLSKEADELHELYASGFADWLKKKAEE